MIAASFRREARFAWRAMVEAATDAERPALVEIADLLFEYVDRVSRIYSEVYGSAEKRRGPSAEEEAARELLRRIAAEDETLTEDQQLAERIGFRLERAATPFVIAIPDGSAQRHAELRGAVALAAGQGDSGEIEVGDYLPALMLGLSPRIAGQIRARVYSPLDGDHPELVRTLDALIKNNFEKGRVAAVLHVHRNTLRDRIARISELTGLDLEGVEGRGLAWLAWLARGESAG